MTKYIDNARIALNCPNTKQGWNRHLYSQFYEDYILSMVFANIDKGNYVDVGANNPTHNSVTQYFYLKGWRGIHIEPIKRWYNTLTQERPNSINLNIGLSNITGELEFFDFTNFDGLSTFDPNVALFHKKTGKSYNSYKVPIETLSWVLEKYPFNNVINFIKIDVEGFEKEVLEGIDLKKFRPQVFIIEATKPNTFVLSHQPWEYILLNDGYDFAIFDGLNRYYLAKEYNKILAPNFHKAIECVQAVDWYHDVWKGLSKITINNDL